MKNKMGQQIIFVTDGIYPNTIGGMQMHSYRLLHGLLEHGFNVILIYPKQEKDQLFSLFNVSLKAEKLKLVPIERQQNYPYKWSYLVAELKYGFAVAGKLNKLNDNVIYSQGLTSLFFIKRTHKKSIKTIVNPHGLEPYQSFFKKAISARIYRMLFNYIFKHADRVVSLGGSLTQIIQSIGIPNKNIAVLPNGIAESWMKNKLVSRRYSGKLRLLFVGRDEPRKALSLLLKVINTMQLDNIHLTIVGPFESKPEIECDNVKFVGAITDELSMKLIFDACDVLVCPSLAEGMPTVILEGMARGLAIIATDVGATSELVTSVNGILIKPNQLEELQQAIIKVANLSEESLWKLKEGSMEKVKEFTWKKVTKKTIEVIQDL